MDEKIKCLLTSFGFNVDNLKAEQIKREEDDSYYDVWRVYSGSDIFILKECKEYESDIYNTILKSCEAYVPKCFGTANYDGSEFILLENLEGDNLNNCSRKKLISFLDSLIYLQNKFWQNESFSNILYNVENSLINRKKRGNYLNDANLEKYYNKYLDLYTSVPCTLCNDDMLPFNAIYNEEKNITYIIDWEKSGILPYLNSFARFIAHSEEKEDAFFYMKDADKAFAIDYYYDNLLKAKGIAYQDYRMHLSLFMLYEFCEWIMLGNKYEDADKVRFEKYKEKASKLIEEIKLVDNIN